MDLVSFAAKLKPACFICTIPERDEIEMAWGKGVRSSAIIAWLVDVREHDAEAVPERKRIDQHFDGNHHKRAGK